MSCPGDVSYVKPFQATKGWFEILKVPVFVIFKFKGETSSVDYAAAESFPDVLKKLAEEKGCLPERVFNADETGLFWKQMRVRTFTRKTEKAAKIA